MNQNDVYVKERGKTTYFSAPAGSSNLGRCVEGMLFAHSRRSCDVFDGRSGELLAQRRSNLWMSEIVPLLTD